MILTIEKGDTWEKQSQEDNALEFFMKMYLIEFLS